MSLHWDKRAGWVSVPDATCAYCDQPVWKRTHGPDIPHCRVHAERADTEARIQRAEDYLRDHGNALFCGEQDRVCDYISDLRRDLEGMA